MSKLQVNKIEKANKEGYVVVNVQYEGTSNVYTYVRRAYPWGGTGTQKSSVVIGGERIVFNKSSYDVESITKEYETKGKKRLDTSTGSTLQKLKNEMQESSIEVPEVEFNETEAKHEKYNQIKTCLECNLPVYLAGPAGSGKNFTVEQICEELGWNFYFSNSVQQEFKLTGFIDAGGKYHETEFYKACNDENDCVFFLDEMDASIPEVLVLLNAAIANGYFEFPTGRVNLEHVHFVSAGNTVGSGADELYAGRMVLDQATLDRFVIIDFDYSLSIERFLAKGNMSLVNFIHDLRKFSTECGVRATFSYRCIKSVVVLEATKQMDMKDIIAIAVVKGLDKDTIKTFNISGDTKYHKALKALQKAA